ncbi:hypothetical protein [Dyadobacter beijingensis]|nr:hypothetical protein [Dyadobacter beijingensis]
MRQFAVMIFLVTMSIYQVLGQKYPLKLMDSCPETNAKFRKILAIDKRTNPEMIGYVSLSSPSSILAVQHDGKLADSIARLIGMPDKSGKDTLVMIMDEFFINGISSPGKVRTSLRFFKNEGTGGYHEFFSVDSTFKTAKRYSNEELINMINNELCLVARSLRSQSDAQTPTRPMYSFAELVSLDSLEKLKIPIYNIDSPASGVYMSFDALKENRPSVASKILIERKKGKFVVFRHYKNDMKKVLLDPQGIFAVSDGVTLLRVFDDGQFFPITKRGFDLYYDREISSQLSRINEFNPYLFPDGGHIGATLGGDLVIRRKSDDLPKMTYRYKMNYRTGVGHPVNIINR